MNRIVWCALLMAAFTVCLAGQLLSGNPYEPIPARFHIPEIAARLDAWVKEMNIKELRRHGWQLLAGLTSPSHARRPGNDGLLPIWETWYSQPETFRPPSAEPRTLMPLFEYPPHQLEPVNSTAGRIVSVAARIFFNQEAHDHIQANCLYTRAKLECLRAIPPIPGPDGSPGVLEIPDFKRESVALKTAWMHVTQKCTPIPVWDGEPPFPRSTTNPPRGWSRRIWVYPHNVSPDTCGTGGKRVSIDEFYHFKITSPEEVKYWQTGGGVLTDPTTGPLMKDDYVVLVGLHAATREIDNWVWATYWWHDRPNGGPFGSDRPSSIRHPWRNYLMDVAYDMDRPPEHDTSPKITFNPYLEASLAEGVRSNCMTCHRRAVIPNKPNVVTSYSFGDEVQQDQIVIRGSEAATATYFSEPGFESRLKLHFIWSLAAHTDPKTDPIPLPAGCGCSNQ